MSEEKEIIPEIVPPELATIMEHEAFPNDLIKSESDEELRSRIINRSQKLDTDNLLLAKDLYIVFHNKKYEQWGYHTFIDYVVQEVGITESMANGLRKIWKKFAKQLNVDNKKLVGVGYSRVQMILPVLDNNNVDEWVNKAKELKLKDLTTEISKAKRSKEIEKLKNSVIVETKEEHDARLAKELQEKDSIKTADALPVPMREQQNLSPSRRTFMLYPEQMQVVNTALEIAEHLTGSSKEGNNLTCALVEFLSQQISKETKVHDRMTFYMKQLERMGGGRLIWFKDEKVFEKLEKLLDDHPEIFENTKTTKE